MQIVLATTNPHKLEEIRSIFGHDAPDSGIDWLLLDGLADEFPGGIAEPVEDQPTFEGNAVLKARHYAKLTGRACLADDSGLEVDALAGSPGVRSARYSGTQGPRSKVDPANNVKLLEALSATAIENRAARFVCAMSLAIPLTQLRSVQVPAGLVHPGDDLVGLVVRGAVEGRILLPEEADDSAAPEAGRGTHGFGYDPLFALPDSHPFAGRTTAQLTPEQKNSISHRGDASRKLLAEMQATGLI